MAGITLAQAEARLTAYLAAEEAVLTGQMYRMGERQLTRANLAEIQTGIKLWDERTKALSSAASGRGRSRTIAPGF
jgi:hypothetical protein